MRAQMDELEARVRSLCAQVPDSDEESLAAQLVERSELGQRLAGDFDAFRPSTRRLVCAHGRWSAWDARALHVGQVTPEQASLAAIELVEAGWLQDRRFPLAVRAWRRHHAEPTPEQVQRAADAAETAFHHLRYASLGDVGARAEVEAWERWSPHPQVWQWAAIVREQPLDDAACDRCAVWDRLEQSRATRFHGWNDLSARLLDQAESLADTPRARFFVRFLRALRAVQAGDASSVDQVAALESAVTDEGERFFVHQAQAVLAQATGDDPRVPLLRSVQLAQRMGLPAREALTRVLLAHAAFPDGARMRQQLELVDVDRVRPTGRPFYNLHWAWARAWLADREIQRAAEHARKIVADPEAAGVGSGTVWGVICLAEVEAGDHQAARTALANARRYLAGPSGDRLLAWVERVSSGGPYDPFPDMSWAPPLRRARLRADGRACLLADGTEVDLSRSPVSVAILRALARRPHTTDALIEAVWPDDASAYSSLKARLHSAIRALRNRGLFDHVQFVDGAYRLDGLHVEAQATRTPPPRSPPDG